ncbi:hypothetical protein E4U21_002442 [Claviceps maximensis]|nr:hypothetical protein E4U21_002442 [Claviceps maximensis]
MLSVAQTVALFLGVASQIQAAQVRRDLVRHETTRTIANEAKVDGTDHSKSASQGLDGTGDANSLGTSTEKSFINKMLKTTLLPEVHWSYDTKMLANVVPVEPHKGTELYYGVSDPSISGHFAFLTYHFTLPSVNIDHTDHVNVQYNAQDGITASFTNQEAFDHAVKTWSTKNGLLLIAHVPGCGGYVRGERCYFSVTDLKFNHQELSVVAKGSSKHPDEITTYGETEWGWWNALKSDVAGLVATAATADIAPNEGLASRSGEDAGGTSNISPDRRMGNFDCVSPPDGQFGLPTACLGTSFDQVLDDKLGHDTLSAESTQYLEDVMSSTFSGFKLADSTLLSSSIAASRRRATRSSLAQRSFWSGVGDFFKRALDTIYDALKNVQAIGADMSREFSFKLPDPQSPNSAARTLLGGLVQAQSPWGEAILLNTLQHPNNNGTALKVYCVDCGVAGHARVAGHAKWSPRNGLQEGRVELTTNLQMMLKIGLDGEANFNKAFSLDLLSYGLPALSYGVVEIGPYVTLGARVDFAAGSRGNVLAGAEVGLQDARVVMNLVGSAPADKSGWGTPYFKPIFESAGQVDVSAELGLPIGIKCGVKISTWETAVGVVDEPSIKGSAIGGASTSLTVNGTEHGLIANGTGHGLTLNGTGYGAMTSQVDNKCAGIMTQFSWRNKLWAGYVKPDDAPILDTDDHVAFSKCIDKSSITAARALMHVRRGPRYRQLLARATAPTKLYDEATAHTKRVELVNPHESTKMVSCANGNLYAVINDDSTNEFCFGQWETTKTQQSAVVYDGVHRPMHYYRDTMSALGVSRLRVSNAGEMPHKAVIVTLIPLQAPKSHDQLKLHVALDSSREVFYPVVCDYVDKSSASKVFLVRDPVKGPEILQRKDVMHSVTGGLVAQCKVLALKAKA